MPNPARHTALIELTHERLRELLDFDPATGRLSWRAERSNSIPAGSEAGWLSVKGYRVVEVDRKSFPAHRLAWFHATGSWPAGQVDHINGNRLDNRLENLRVVNNSVNQQNKKRARSDSRTGIIGVHLHASGRYQAKINVGGRQRSLGMFATAIEAQAAYLAAKRQHHEGCTI